jgi:hypothetical protein
LAPWFLTTDRPGTALDTEAHDGTKLPACHDLFKRISLNRRTLVGPKRCHDEIAALQRWTLQA